MKKIIVLLGGNGYIGRELTKAWHDRDKSAQFIVLSRSGNNQLKLPEITNVAVDLTDHGAVDDALPTKFDYIVDLIGRPEKDVILSKKVNDQPAMLMKRLAETHNAKAMGFIGGKLGPKYFLNTKKRLIGDLRQSTVPLAIVEPTLVYGAGRKDQMSRMVPLLRFFGIFNVNMKPVEIHHVVNELLEGLLTVGEEEVK
ncbi:NAD-dependent epimerase/dehydratase family protein [Pediococcus ethanolidurans]|uniref:NAD dependent epimerase/dehydratase family protein n=1 Tax=Pediococcus ethanolidurans TaxID=319653 RepID=A0A0R2K1L2_9LACO|nr:NAD-dependent epimerase/dehydratase family protein [Pediococcus ethanolidurans]KRN83427.1 hypothetical protein IV87_GL000858 [Pediococcus ethanolidurans]GEN94471.1 UDP-glucose 4-epimerase [Pediococcus ethanolidurans]SER23889.1 NAD dependent epimerase/dehydratase family protein [Pediococcus ethanolidurans]